MQNLNIAPSKLITPNKKFIGWYNPYHFGNKKLRKIYNIFAINNKGNIPKNYIQEADIFYSPYYPIPTNLNQTKKCITIYDLIPVMPKYAHFINKDLQHIKQEIQEILNSLTHTYISTISAFTKQDLLEYCPHINPTNVTPIHLGIDEKKFNANHTETDWVRVKARYNLPDNYFLTLGTVEPRKNCLYIIESFKHFLSEHPIEDIYLVVAGNQTIEYQKILKNQAGLKNNIIFTGRVDDNDIAVLYSRANSFYFMSLAEGFGFPPLEAMACGVPVVSSNATSLPEIIGSAGILLDPSDKNSLPKTMFDMYQDNALRKKYVHLGLEHVKQFTWEKTANQYYNLFKQIIDKSF